MFNLRKIGGMYWISIGRVRIAICVVSKRPSPRDWLKAIKQELAR